MTSKVRVLKSGGLVWFNDKGEVHRDEDKPSRIYPDGLLIYYKCNKCHREGDEPAFIRSDVIEYLKYGELHRDNNLPAVIYSNGTEIYFKNGQKYFP